MEISWPYPATHYQAETEYRRREPADPMITDDDYHSILRSGYASNSLATFDDSEEFSQEAPRQVSTTAQSKGQAVEARRGPVGENELSLAALSFLWDDPPSSPTSFEAPALEKPAEAGPPLHASSSPGQIKPRSRRRIDPREWEERRQVITDLYQNHSLSETRKLMEDQHQFFASYVRLDCAASYKY